MDPRLDLDLLRSFVVVLDVGGFARAAQVVHRSPAAVSMQIRKLEDTLGRRLFDRDTRNVRPTADAEILIGYARRMLRLHDEALEAVRRPEVAGRVVVAAPDDYARALLPGPLGRFGALFPRVEVEVVCAQTTLLLPMLAGGTVDLAFVSRTRGVTGDLVRVEPMVWVAAPGSDIHRRSPLPVALYESHSPARLRATEALDRAGIDYRATHSSPSLLGLLAMVEADLAVAALARCSAPAGVAVLDMRHGLPPIADLEVVLSRSAGSRRPACEALVELIIGGSKAPSPPGPTPEVDSRPRFAK
ncbi:LysR substrate-binding domain-containing protein [Thalassobaculum sp.]|uniref:LysR substrate-binding domain-containing protein n=1 Tax=Thalassobaculum sp. TaxID=2022740 RepID=UPI0032EC0365